MAKDEFRLVGRHPEDLSDGRVIAPGEKFKADSDDERVQRLVDEGAAIKTEPKRKSNGGS